ncbi:MAG: ThiF family adenylyltransferase, partial [Bacteroidales bacterium]
YQRHDNDFIPCEMEIYSISLDVFSRNSGILETRMMNTKKAVLVGCGSVGSYVALELARSGVGSFLLIDHDTFSYTNICRHQCGLADVGRYKTLALADRIRLINPAAVVQTRESVVENSPPQLLEAFCGPDAIIIGCADNRQGDLFACKIAAHYGMPMISIGFWERAFAGEVFFWIPDDPRLACYNCFTRALGDISQRESVNRRFYTNEEDLSKVTFMPGISVDINFVTNIGTKIILDILNRHDPKYPPRLIDTLTQFTLIANTNKKALGGEQAEIFSYPLQVTTSIEVEKLPGCKFCNPETQHL